MSALKAYTMMLTQTQIAWLKSKSKETGLKQVEIVRRIIDDYVESEERKIQQNLLTPEQRREIKQIAREKGVSEVNVIRTVLEKELRHRDRLKKA